MKEKLFDPARNNEQSPSEGMAAANTHNPEETPIKDTIAKERKEDDKTHQQTADTQEENDKGDS